MRCAPNDRRDGENAASVARLLPVRLSFGAQSLAVLAIAFLISLVPVGARVQFSPALDGVSACVYKSEACALAAPNQKALLFLEQCAEAAGMSVKDFMLTEGIIIAGATGLNVLAEDTSYAAAQTNNTVVKVVSTLEWPDWDELTEEQKTSYDNNQDLYYANQFNALAGCFGLADARDVYYSSGGGDLDGETVSTLQRIGEIGNKFATGAILDASDVYTLITHPEQLINNSGYNNFGLRLTKTVNIDDVSYRFMRANPNLPGYMYRYPIVGDNWFLYKQNVNMSPGNYQWVFVGIWTSPMYKIEISSGYGLYNYQNVNSSNQYQGLNTSGAIEEHASSGNRYRGTYNPEYDYLNEDWGGGWTIAGTDIDTDEVNYNQQLPDTPNGLFDKDGINDEKMPEGIGSKELRNDITYPEITGTPRDGDLPPYTPPTPEERPENPYNPPDAENPGYQSGTPEWKQETTENLIPLMNVRLDRLFPFCLVYDLQLLWTRLNVIFMSDGTLEEQAIEDYTHISIPLNFGSDELGLHYQEVLELDLTPLRELLTMTKPFMFALLVVLMVTSIIAFWKRILTGG